VTHRAGGCSRVGRPRGDMADETVATMSDHLAAPPWRSLHDGTHPQLPMCAWVAIRQLSQADVADGRTFHQRHGVVYGVAIVRPPDKRIPC
jgi:hypothetical protein